MRTFKRKKARNYDTLLMLFLILTLAVAISLVSMQSFVPSMDQQVPSQLILQNNERYRTHFSPQTKTKKASSTISKAASSIRIPSHNKKYHLKEILHKDLQNIVSISHQNNTYITEIHEDISSYLSFAIIGMSKTGTTSLLRTLVNSTNMISKERCDLVNDDIPLLLNALYNLKQSSSNPNLPTGIKCPQDVSSTKSIDNYKKHFYKTKLIIGLRHPILWFESLYNFNVRNMNKMIHTDKLERCVRGSHGICAWRANIADFLAALNKTPLNKEEMQYMALQETQQRKDGNVGPVFLYEISQLNEDNKGVSSELRKDLAEFLGIKESISEFPHVSTAGVLDWIDGIKDFTQDYMIDICDEEHAFIRSLLMTKAKNASEWILKYFLQSADVHVSSREYFIKQIKGWSQDPCIYRAKTK